MLDNQARKTLITPPHWLIITLTRDYLMIKVIINQCGGVRGLLAAVQDATSQLAVKGSAMSGEPVTKIHILGALAVLLYAVSDKGGDKGGVIISENRMNEESRSHVENDKACERASNFSKVLGIKQEGLKKY